MYGLIEIFIDFELWFQKLKVKFNMMRELKEASGLGWNEEKQTVLASEDFWPTWNAVSEFCLCMVELI